MLSAVINLTGNRADVKPHHALEILPAGLQIVACSLTTGLAHRVWSHLRITHSMLQYSLLCCNCNGWSEIFLEYLVDRCLSSFQDGGLHQRKHTSPAPIPTFESYNYVTASSSSAEDCHVQSLDNSEHPCRSLRSWPITAPNTKCNIRLRFDKCPKHALHIE